MQDRELPKKGHNFSNVTYCNIIIRAYLQKCKKCDTEGKTRLNERAFSKIVDLGSKEIFKFYGIRPKQKKNRLPPPRLPGPKTTDHQPDLCLACKQFSCIWYWQEIRLEIGALYTLFINQDPEVTVPELGLDETRKLIEEFQEMRSLR